MINILKSSSFKEFIQKRCEEIIENDEGYQKYSVLILKAENSLLSLLQSDNLKIFQEYEKLNTDLIAYVQPLIYEQGLKDFKIGR